MSAFVGRQRELEFLERRLERALAGEGGAVFLTGDAGAGKSALAERFLVEAALRTPDARIISATCSEQYGAGEPYQPFVEALRDFVSGGDRPEGRSRFRDLARELAPYWLAAVPVAGDLIAATMATAVELKQTLGGAVATAAPPSEEALFFQYTEFLLAAAAEHPVVLLIDDLHWADRASVSLLAHVARKIADKPVLIIGTYRPADVEVTAHPIKQAKLELERYGIAEELALTPLDSDALAELIREELDAPPTPELVRWLEDRAGSNALFFAELLKWLVERGLARKHHGEWALAHIPGEIEIPRSAESVIEKRLDRLEPELYRLLEYASVEGDSFQSTTLAQLLNVDELALEDMVEPLVRVHGLVRLADTRELPNGELASVYEFSHTLFQDVLHKKLQGKRRILLHRKMAQILEEIYESDATAVAHKLAVHYDEGRLSDRAYEFAVLAAEHAGRVYAHWDAIELLQRALRNSRTDEQKVGVLDRLGEENRLIGHYSDALSHFGEALESARSRDDRHQALALKRKAVLVERDYGQRAAGELLEQLTELAAEARELGAPAELCRILLTFRGLPGTAGADDPTREAVQEAVEIAEAVGDPTILADAHYQLAIVLMFREDPAASIPHLQRALQLYSEPGDKGRAGLCHNCLGIVNLLLGEYRAAAEEFDAAATIFDEVGDPVNEASVRNNFGALLTRMGEWGRAEENLHEAVRLAQRLDAAARLLHPLQNLAELYQAKGDRESAADHWQRMLEQGAETGYKNEEVIAHCGLGVVRLEEGDLSGARTELETARELMGEPEAWTESREAWELLAARLTAAEGDISGAVRALEAAEAAVSERDRFLWATYRLTHGEIVSLEDPAGAAPIIREALETFDQLGAEPMRRRAATLLAGTGGAS